MKHKIWVATVHDPYSFRGPEDKAAGGGASESLALQQNGAPRGWSAPAEGEASVNQDEVRAAQHTCMRMYVCAYCVCMHACMHVQPKRTDGQGEGSFDG